MKKFSELLEELRDQRKISKKDLAIRTGLSAGYISLLTRGEREAPSVETVKALADALHLDLEMRSQFFAAAGHSSPSDWPFSSSSIPTLKRHSSVDRTVQDQQEREAWSSLNEREARLEEISSLQVPLSSAPENPSYQEDLREAPHIAHFYGRDNECAELEQWIMDGHCRMVAVLGIGGIGKTSLAAILTKQIKDEFTNVLWCSLQDSPAIENILERCIQFFSRNQQMYRPKDIDNLIELLIRYLQEYRCLLVLDNFESVIPGGYQHDYKQHYGKLLQRLGEDEHQSCVILTSREKPREFAPLEGKTSPVRSMSLRGVGLLEGRELLKGKGLFGSDEAWKALIERYSGNPLALKLVSEPIREVFEGDVAAFLQEGEFVFGDLYELLDQQFKRLSEHERRIVYWLAIEREAVSRDALWENVRSQLVKKELFEALNSLKRRSLIESGDAASFTLQPVILEYMAEKFVEQVYNEIRDVSISEKGVFGSHPLIKAQAKEYVRDNQMRFILRPLAKRLRTNIGKVEAEKRLKQMLVKLHEPHLQKLEYAAGNILNLLIELECDLRGCDFSHLTVWQAYLQGVTLPDTNFAYADLEKSVFTETFGSILSVAFSPQGNLFAAGTANAEIRIWQFPGGILSLTCKEHLDWVRSVAFSPDGNTIVSASEDQTVRLWNSNTGQCLKILEGHTARVDFVAFSPDGNTIASAGEDRTIRLWSTTTGQCLKILEGHQNRIWSVTFDPGGTLLASGSEDQTVRLWEVDTGHCLRTLEAHTATVRSVAFNSDGTLLLSASHDQKLRLWDVATGQCTKTLSGHTHRVYSAAFSPEGSIIASASEDRTVRLWDVSTGQVLRSLTGHVDRVKSVVFSSNGSIIVSGSEDQTIRFWNAGTGQCLKILQGYSSWIHAVAFSRDGTLLASGGEDGIVRLWDWRNTSNNQPIKTLRGHQGSIRSLAFSPNRPIIASASEDQTIRLWDTGTGQWLKALQGHSGRIWSIVFSSDGNFLASCSDDQTIRLWNVYTGQGIRTFYGHSGRVRSIAISPDSKMLISGSEDQTIRLWNLHTGQCLNTLQGQGGKIWSIAISPDGKTLISSGEDQTIRLWDVHTGQCLNTLQGYGRKIWSIAISPDGSTVASGNEDFTVDLLNIHTGQHLTTLHGHENRIRSVAFSPDGDTIASGSHDGTIKLWSAKDYTVSKTLRTDRPYERMNITQVRGLTDAQKAILRALGAVD